MGNNSALQSQPYNWTGGQIESNRAGSVYILKSKTEGLICGCYKIGATVRWNKGRLYANKKKWGDFNIVCFIHTDEPPYRLEKELQNRFKSKRVYKDWFKLDADDFQYIQSLAELRGYPRS